MNVNENDAYRIPKWFIGFVAFCFLFISGGVGWLVYEVVRISIRTENLPQHINMLYEHELKIKLIEGGVLPLKRNQ